MPPRERDEPRQNCGSRRRHADSRSPTTFRPASALLGQTSRCTWTQSLTPIGTATRGRQLGGFDTFDGAICSCSMPVFRRGQRTARRRRRCTSSATSRSPEPGSPRSSAATSSTSRSATTPTSGMLRSSMTSANDSCSSRAGQGSRLLTRLVGQRDEYRPFRPAAQDHLEADARGVRRLRRTRVPATELSPPG